MKPINPKSRGEQFMDDLFLVGIICIVSYLIQQIFAAIFSPFKYLTMSNEQIEAEEVEKAKEKVRRRQEIRGQYDDDPNNPLNQYILRFKKYPEKYEGDPENKQYERWYDAWIEGMVLDSYMYWAPEVYNMEKGRIFGRKTFSKDFLDYLENQRRLHLRSLIGARNVFLSTIRKYYPEFTANLSVMKAEIAELMDMTVNYNLHQELLTEIKKLGVPDRIAQKLSKAEIAPEEILEKAKLIRDFHQQGINDAACDICAKHYRNPESLFWKIDPNFGPRSELASLVNEVVYHLGHYGETVILAYLRQNITAEDIRDIIVNINEQKESLGAALFEPGPNGKCLFDEMIDAEIDKRLKASLKR